jgi:uncharacterized damage-inducible protein DinB
VLQPGSERATALARRLEDAAFSLIGVIGAVRDDQWRLQPGPGIWSISKEVEHVIEAAAYHQWIVRRTIGHRVPSRKPVLERARMTWDASPAEAMELVRQRTSDGVRLLLDLTDAQLDLPTRPPRAREPSLAETIEAVMIDHCRGHRSDIEAKLRALDGST